MEDEEDVTRHDRLNGVVEVFKIIRQKEGKNGDLPMRPTVGMPQYDKALLGYYAVEPVDSDLAGGFRAVYSMQGILDCLCEEMTIEDAMEHFEYNIAGSMSPKQDAEDWFDNKPIKPLIISTFAGDH